MLHIVTTDNYYIQAADCWKEINELPQGKLYHKIHDTEDVRYHLFSSAPITKTIYTEWIEEEFGG